MSVNASRNRQRQRLRGFLNAAMDLSGDETVDWAVNGCRRPLTGVSTLVSPLKCRPHKGKVLNR